MLWPWQNLAWEETWQARWCRNRNPLLSLLTFSFLTWLNVCLSLLLYAVMSCIVEASLLLAQIRVAASKRHPQAVCTLTLPYPLPPSPLPIEWHSPCWNPSGLPLPTLSPTGRFRAVCRLWLTSLTSSLEAQYPFSQHSLTPPRAPGPDRSAFPVLFLMSRGATSPCPQAESWQISNYLRDSLHPGKCSWCLGPLSPGLRGVVHMMRHSI